MTSETRRPSRPLLGIGALLVALAVALPASIASAQIPTVPGLPGSFMQGPDDIEMQVLSTATQDPTAIDAAPDGRVVWVERKGFVKVLLADGTTVVQAGRLGVAANECPDCPDNLNEGGLHGLLLAKDFVTTGRLFLYYSVPGSLNPATGEGKFRLSEFTMRADNTLDLASEVSLLENPAEWKECCHYGGDLDYLPDGTITLSVADDTNPFDSNGFSPIDERPGREAWDAQRTSQNKLDRRGKVLRLNEDGSVPANNPHVGDATYDPYVFAMGFRSDYRLANDPKTGTVYVGNVGPDSSSQSANRGPAGHDELEVVPPGGGTNHGWPYCIANNVPYYDYDFETGQSGAAFSCAGFVPAAMAYTSSFTPSYPQLGTGGRTIMPGLVYDYAGTGSRKLPARFQAKLITFEWSRNLVLTIPVKADGTLDTLTTSVQKEIVSGSATARHPHDAAIGKDGAVYILEYGTGFWQNSNSRLSRLQCKGCAAAPTTTVTPGDAASAQTATMPPIRGTVGLLGLSLLGLGLLRRRTTA